MKKTIKNSVGWEDRIKEILEVLADEWVEMTETVPFNEFNDKPIKQAYEDIQTLLNQAVEAERERISQAVYEATGGTLKLNFKLSPKQGDGR